MHFAIIVPDLNILAGTRNNRQIDIISVTLVKKGVRKEKEKERSEIEKLIKKESGKEKNEVGEKKKKSGE